MNSTPSEEILPRKSTYAILYSQAANVIASFCGEPAQDQDRPLMIYYETPRDRCVGLRWRSREERTRGKRSDDCGCEERTHAPLAFRRFPAVDHRGRGHEGRLLFA